MLTAVAAGLLVGAALHDIGFRTIPDRACIALAAVGLALHAAAPMVPLSLAAAVFAGGLALWRHGWLGGGDVKLAAAAALAVPAGAVGGFLLATALAGGVLALLVLLLAPLVPAPSAGRPRTLVARIARAEAWRLRRHGPLPYGAAVAAGALLMLPVSFP